MTVTIPVMYPIAILCPKTMFPFQKVPLPPYAYGFVSSEGVHNNKNGALKVSIIKHNRYKILGILKFIPTELGGGGGGAEF